MNHDIFLSVVIGIVIILMINYTVNDTIVVD